MKCCINGGYFIRLLFLLTELRVLKFEIQKCSQILCTHKPYFLMPVTYTVNNFSVVTYVLGWLCSPQACYTTKY